MNTTSQHYYEFGPFCVDARERVLLRDGTALPLTPKALETLLVLVQNHGHIVEKDELMNAIWPEVFVDENNLAQAISQIRKVLGESPEEEKYIQTVPRRGYRFVAAVAESGQHPEQTTAQTTAPTVFPREKGVEGTGAGRAEVGAVRTLFVWIRRHWFWVFGVVALLLLLLAVLPSKKIAGARGVARVTLQGNAFVAEDGVGKLLWRYQLPADSPADIHLRAPGINYIGDLDGDGHKEVLISVPYPGLSPYQQPEDDSANERELYCFSESGKQLWHFEFREKLKFGAGDYESPWLIRVWKVFTHAGATRIALVLHHRPWWPSILLILDSRGQEVGRFVNSGIILTLTRVERQSGSLLLVGGLSNGNDETGTSGMLAVLDEDHISGSSPERQPGFECKSCVPARPLRYFVFSRSELNQLPTSLSSYNQVTSVIAFETRIQVVTIELLPSANGIFEFSHGFELQRASYSDGYWELHRQLEREGKIGHSRENCRDRFGPQLVRSWDLKHGWTKILSSPPKN